jgi:hypothetical protein
MHLRNGRVLLGVPVIEGRTGGVGFGPSCPTLPSPMSSSSPGSVAYGRSTRPSSIHSADVRVGGRVFDAR